MTIEERLEKIEKQNSRLRRLAWAAVAIALAAFVGGTAVWVRAADGTFDTLTARTIYVKDASGKVRVLLSPEGQVVVADANSKVRVDLRSTGHVLVNDAAGANRVLLDANTNMVVLKNAAGGVVANGDFEAVSAKVILVKDSSNRPRLYLDGASGLIDVKDANGRTRAYLRSDGNVVSLDQNGRARVVVTANGTIAFYNASGGLVKMLP